MGFKGFFCKNQLYSRLVSDIILWLDHFACVKLQDKLEQNNRVTFPQKERNLNWL